MKKIFFISMVFLGITLSAYADEKRSCPVYGNKDYTVKLANGSTMAKADKYGTISVSVIITGPQISVYQNGSFFAYVYVNAIDRTYKNIAGTGHKNVKVADSKYSNSAIGEEVIYINNLTPDVYYDISIDRATCN